MKVSRWILAGAALVQFSSLVTVSNPDTRTIGIVFGVASGTILLLLALGIYPAARRAEKRGIRNTD